MKEVLRLVFTGCFEIAKAYSYNNSVPHVTFLLRLAHVRATYVWGILQQCNAIFLNHLAQ